MSIQVAKSPKSTALTIAGVRAIVENLEKEFDSYGPKCSTSFGSSWRMDALVATKRELPKIALTGHEIGPTVGLGAAVYQNSSKPEDETSRCDSKATNTESKAKHPIWMLNNVELRHALMQKNPPLLRSNVLTAASGRYVDEIIVSERELSAVNPTGKREIPRSLIRNIAPADLRRHVSEQREGTLLCVACVRQDDRASRNAEVVAESACSGRSDDATFDIVKCDMSVSKHVMESYGVRAVPTFLMFYQNRLVYRGQIGGQAVRIAPDFKPFRILYVEPNFKDQLTSEKVLRKQRFACELCLNAAQAGQRKQAIDCARAQQGDSLSPGKHTTYDVVFVSSALCPDDCTFLEQLFGPDTLVCGLASLSGAEGAEAMLSANWSGRHRGISFDVDWLLPQHVASISRMALTKPLKATALEDLSDFLIQNNKLEFSGVQYKGLTPTSLLQKIAESKTLGQRGIFVEEPLDDTATRSLHSSTSNPWRQKARAPPRADVTLQSLIATHLD